MVTPLPGVSGAMPSPGNHSGLELDEEANPGSTSLQGMLSEKEPTDHPDNPRADTVENADNEEPTEGDRGDL